MLSLLLLLISRLIDWSGLRISHSKDFSSVQTNILTFPDEKFILPLLCQVFFTGPHSILKLQVTLLAEMAISGASRGGWTEFRPPSQHILPPPQHILPPPPHSSPAWSWFGTIFCQILSIKKKIPKSFYGASRNISNRISIYFLVFDLKNDSHS